MNSPVKTLLRRIHQLHQGADPPSATDPMPSLRLSRFDAVSSFLSALMIFLSAMVSMLFLLWWLASGPATQPGMQIERTLTSASPIGFAQDFEPPAAFGGGDNAIESASHLATQPVRHVNRQPGTEQRLYFSWKRTNPFAQFDRQLLAAANIPTAGRNVVRFLPRDLEEILASMEKGFCENNGKSFPGDIAKTTFQSDATENGFAFQVVNQRYRSDPDR
ncbi:hypothetical protein [Stieleria magnilauensis]|uniref:Uncharacterized protein n=1 Tax=Stieleria magnilauensis TaxID=2527963 RepID=A0ABX5XYJ6_9BACT|nr:hypothetical protein TBK1r_61070 [Planctomycetes bacterium TBK1r]